MPPPPGVPKSPMRQLSPGRKSPRSPLCCPGESRTAARSPRRSPVLRPRSGNGSPRPGSRDARSSGGGGRAAAQSLAGHRFDAAMEQAASEAYQSRT